MFILATSPTCPAIWDAIRIGNLKRSGLVHQFYP
jgi:hypothetical protein